MPLLYYIITIVGYVKISQCCVDFFTHLLTYLRHVSSSVDWYFASRFDPNACLLLHRSVIECSIQRCSILIREKYSRVVRMFHNKLREKRRACIMKDERPQFENNSSTFIHYKCISNVRQSGFSRFI